MYHALLIMTLVIHQLMTALFQRLTKPGNTAVAEDSKYTLYKLVLFSVYLNILIV